jgi:site-specific DNA-methyltransferase (adenine-specific)
MTNSQSTARLASGKLYHSALWKQEPPGKEYFAELRRVSKNAVVFGGNYFSDFLPPSQCWLVWDKVTGENDFADVELAWTSFNQASRLFRFQWAGMLKADRAEKRIHPTQKPVALYKWIFSRYAKPGYKILDTHLGSGSSRVAAYDLRLDFWGYEIDPIYFAGQEKRFAAHIQQQSLFEQDGTGWEQTSFLL